MSGTTETPKSATKKSRILRICIIVIVCLLVLLPTVFWLITTSAFITGIVLPLVSSSIDMRIAADDVELSLFKSTLRAKNIRLGSGKTALVKAEHLEGIFSLNDLLNARFVFRDVLLDKAVITISREDGKWTYDSPGKKTVEADSSAAKTNSASATASPEKTKDADKVLLNLKNIRITNSSFVLATGTDTPGSARLELSELNIDLPEFVNNKTATLTLKAHTKINGGSIRVQNGDWNLKLSATFNDYLHPLNIKCESDLDHLNGEINGVRLDNSNLALDIDAEGNHESIAVKNLCLRQMDGKWIKTNVQSSSQITFEPFKITGKIKVAPLSSEIVAIVSQFTRQVNPGKVSIDWNSDFEISADNFSAAGKLKLARKGTAVINGKEYAFPDLKLKSDYDFVFNSQANSLEIRNLAAELNESDKKVLTLTIDQAFTYLFEQNRIREKQTSQLTLQLQELDLTLFKLLRPFDKNFSINDGRLYGKLNFAFAQNQQVLFDVNFQASQLDFTAGGHRYKGLELEQQLSGSISKKLFLSISKFRTAVKNKQQAVLDFKGVSNIDLGKKQADFSFGMSRFSTRSIPNLPLPPEQLKGLYLFTRLEPFFLSLTCAGKFDLGAGTIAMKPVKLGVFQNDRKVAELTAKLQDGKIAGVADQTELTLDVDKMELSQFNSLLGTKTFSNGTLNGKVIGNTGKSFKSLNLKSSLNAADLELMRGGHTIKNLFLKLAFSTKLQESGRLQMQNLVCGLRQNRNLIFGLSGFGDLNPAAGTGKFKLTLDYLNHYFLNILSPGQFTGGRLKGSLLIDILDQFKQTHIQAALDLLKLKGDTLTDPLDGKVL
ncbi:MAG: hypothetical protein PHV59_05765, partial [Victivallales bacterium]|nr:hypothetical protein [Victivallales bacterium]